MKTISSLQTHKNLPQHPRHGDYQAFLASGAYFAHKFDASQDARILDLRDERATTERPTLAPGASQCALSR